MLLKFVYLVCGVDSVGIKSHRQHKTVPRARPVTTLEKTPHYHDEIHSADSRDHYGSPLGHRGQPVPAPANYGYRSGGTIAGG